MKAHAFESALDVLTQALRIRFPQYKDLSDRDLVDKCNAMVTLGKLSEYYD